VLQAWFSTEGMQHGKGYALALDIARGLAYLHHRQVDPLQRLSLEFLSLDIPPDLPDMLVHSFMQSLEALGSLFTGG
jgi:hypothetical protein